jgi:FkbM family methyltransferase
MKGFPASAASGTMKPIIRRSRAALAQYSTLAALLILLGCRQNGSSLPPEQTHPVAPHKDFLSTEKKLYSQGDEELIIRDFFQDRRDGVFLDVGCAWPIRNNNTFYLEDNLGWWGIAVDALPEYARPWRKRRNSKFFNYLVTDHSDTVESFYRADATGVSSMWTTNAKAQGKWSRVQVPTVTLTKLLDQNKISKIDFMSMDIEDAEPLALAGFDIGRFKPELACVEIHPANREKIVSYFEGHGYRAIERYLKYDQVNYYFAPRVAGQSD